MPLTESQIQRYARHILLPEVGGVGQERLLATGVRVRGESMVVELAGDYLSAAGLQVDAHSGSGLGLKTDAGGVTVRAREGALEVRSSACLVCLGLPSGPLSLEDGCIAATLAASELLVRVLGLHEGNRAFRVEHGRLSTLPFTDVCEEHR
jgi:hypothetical protein